MNTIRYFLRSMRNIFPNNNNENNNENLDNSVHNNEHYLSRENNGRQCGYCRRTGHTVLTCDNEVVISGKREIEDIINNNIFTSRTIVENIVDDWLIDKPDLLLKAIFCKIRILKYSYYYTRNDIIEIIKNYVMNKLYFLRLSEYRNTLNTVQNARITIIIPYNVINTLRDLYKSLSIKIIMVKSKLQHSDKDCPICLDSIEYDNIQKTNCNHEFCKDCLTKTIKGFANRRNYAKCPLCRSNIEIIYQNKKFINKSLE